MGLVVDELIGQQQVVIKSLEANTDPVKGISGATILGRRAGYRSFSEINLGRIYNSYASHGDH